MRPLAAFTIAAVLCVDTLGRQSSALASNTTSSPSDSDEEADSPLGSSPTSLGVLGRAMSNFRWCDDICLAANQHAADTAPSCISTGSQTLKQTYSYQLERCLAVRANVTGKYIPIYASPRTPNCTANEKSDWERAFGDAADKCDDVTIDTEKCSDECLKVIETSVDQAPICKQRAYSYSVHEMSKDYLVNCLQTRGADLKTNTVLQSTVGSNTNGSSSSSAQKTPAPKDMSAAVSSSPIAIVAVVTSGGIALLLMSL